MTISSACPWQETGDGLRLFLRVTPKAAKDGIDGIKTLDDGRKVVLVRVRAIPDKGAANKAVCTVVAKALGVAKSSVALESGSTSRFKTLRIDGDAQQIAASLTALAGSC
ncbi:DUF167 family protein [Stappia sediminis]|uniref:DUF167 family protein n=1 Tax=Stappia sediminis TaxID=2692190 RepID=UPI0028A6EBC3|nr:DUF167 family protein [Stappia sediminis]